MDPLGSHLLILGNDLVQFLELVEIEHTRAVGINHLEESLGSELVRILHEGHELVKLVRLECVIDLAELHLDVATVFARRVCHHAQAEPPVGELHPELEHLGASVHSGRVLRIVAAQGRQLLMGRHVKVRLC